MPCLGNAPNEGTTAQRPQMPRVPHTLSMSTPSPRAASRMVVPVATTQQLTRSFRSTLAGAMALGALASVGGLLLSAYASEHADVAPGPTIVLLALAGFAVSWPVGVLLRSRRRLRRPFPVVEPAAHHTTEEHPHEHGDDCGHVAVPHGDHVDYVHDGHRHAPHGKHYDEH